MIVANVKIMYAGDDRLGADMLMIGLCSEHILAGANMYDAESCLWIGGQLTKKKIIIIEGVTKPEYISRISDYASLHDGDLFTVSVNDTVNERFEKWFKAHL